MTKVVELGAGGSEGGACHASRLGNRAGAKPSVHVSGLEVDLETQDALHGAIAEAVRTRHQRIFYHVNARLIALTRTDHVALRELLADPNSSAFCDGVLVQLYARLSGQRVPEKLAFNTWMWRFLPVAQEEGFRIFFLGAKESVLEDLVRVVSGRFPNLVIAGRHHGYFDHDDPATCDAVVDRINEAKPDVLFVGLGMPAQEYWIGAHASSLTAPAILPCGGAFDFLSGSVPVAPQWIRTIGMEWLFRILVEPRRLLSRNVRDVSRAAYFAVRDLLRL